jgi:hypothetical protein
MSLGAAALISLALLAGLAWYIRRRLLAWAAEVRDVGFPFIHVVVHPAESTQQSFDVTLHDSPRSYPIERISVNVEDLARTGLEPPAGFVRAEALEREIEDESDRPRVWVPVQPLSVTPRETRRLTFRFSATAAEPATITVRLSVRLGIGGGVIPINLRAPMRDARAVALANERANLRLEAHRRNVMPNALPEWADLRRREDQLER